MNPIYVHAKRVKFFANKMLEKHVGQSWEKSGVHVRVCACLRCSLLILCCAGPRSKSERRQQQRSKERDCVVPLNDMHNDGASTTLEMIL